MRNTFSWSCSSCGEYNVVDLSGKAGPQIRCEFCFHPVQATPGFFEGSSAEPPSQPPSDAWIGNAVIRPFFSAAPRPGARGRDGRPGLAPSR
jgi:hypothetical protein